MVNKWAFFKFHHNNERQVIESQQILNFDKENPDFRKKYKAPFFDNFIHKHVMKEGEVLRVGDNVEELITEVVSQKRTVQRNRKYLPSASSGEEAISAASPEEQSPSLLQLTKVNGPKAKKPLREQNNIQKEVHKTAMKELIQKYSATQTATKQKVATESALKLPKSTSQSTASSPFPKGSKKQNFQVSCATTATVVRSNNVKKKHDTVTKSPATTASKFSLNFDATAASSSTAAILTKSPLNIQNLGNHTTASTNQEYVSMIHMKRPAAISSTAVENFPPKKRFKSYNFSDSEPIEDSLQSQTLVSNCDGVSCDKAAECKSLNTQLADALEEIRSLRKSLSEQLPVSVLEDINRKLEILQEIKTSQDANKLLLDKVSELLPSVIDPVGAVKGIQVHVGNGVYADKAKFDKIQFESHTPSMYVRKLSSLLYEDPVLRESSVYGKEPNRCVEKIAKPALSPKRLCAIKASFSKWLGDKGVSGKALAIEEACVPKYIASKIQDLNRSSKQYYKKVQNPAAPPKPIPLKEIEETVSESDCDETTTEARSELGLLPNEDDGHSTYFDEDSNMSGSCTSVVEESAHKLIVKKLFTKASLQTPQVNTFTFAGL